MTSGYTLVRFNPRRAARKAPAAEVRVSDGDNEVVLWMSERDVRLSLRDALAGGATDAEVKGLRDAIAAYRRPWQEIKEPATP